MPVSDFVATIVAGGQRYTDWKTVYVRRDYGDSITHFEFTAAEPGAYGQGWQAIRLKPGDKVQIYLGGHKVVDGNITVREAVIDAQSHDLIISGLSNTELLHSSVKVQPGTFNGSTAEQSMRAVMAPTGVGLRIVNPPPIASKPFKSLSAQYGETILEFCERVCKMRGLFLTDDENGNLVAGDLLQGAPVAELEEGRNILRGSCRLDNTLAFNRIEGAAQQTGNDENWPPRDVSASVSVPGAATTKTKTFLAEHPSDADELQARVAFEACHASWGLVDAQITVVGWQKDDGSLWIPAEHVTVLSRSLFPSTSGAVSDLGIQAVVYAQDERNGTTTTLLIRKSNALSILPSPFDGSTPENPVEGSGPAQAQPGQPDTIST